MKNGKNDDGTLLALYLHYVAVTKEQKEELRELLRERYDTGADNVEIVLSYIEESIKVYKE